MEKQKTRLKKAWCEQCGYTIRLTQKWIEIHFPVCPACNTAMSHELEKTIEDPNQLQIFKGVE